jgi:hypothetical protein
MRGTHGARGGGRALRPEGRRRQACGLRPLADAFAVVAERDSQLVGAVLAAAAASVGWVYRLSLLPGQPEEQEIAERLLAALETRAAALRSSTD